MLAAGATNGYFAVALGVGLTGMFSLFAWIVMKVNDNAAHSAGQDAEITQLKKEVEMLRTAVFVAAWKGPKP